MKARDIQKAGITAPRLVKLAMSLLGPAAQAGLKKRHITDRLRSIVAAPDAHVDDPIFGELARAIVEDGTDAHEQNDPGARDGEPAPWRMWGTDLDRDAINQMRNACALPVAVRGALMPDAHSGYGLPIGGVLATENAVVPYAVGVDIACRMMLSITDLPVDSIDRNRDALSAALEKNTVFGKGCESSRSHNHPVMDTDWDFSPITRKVKEKARTQLGTSGSGNHFVEFVIMTLDEPLEQLAPGTYVGLLSHSGSRGPGATIAKYFWQKAMELHPRLPKQLRHLAWLNLDTDLGREYWMAMQLMGDFAAANHAILHQSVLKSLKAMAVATVENHHNFAWEEEYDGKKLVVHRKGATPAGKGVLALIPGSMATPGFLVQGKGIAEALNSASHGAGRLMSRKEAKNRFAWSKVKKELAAAGITLIGGDTDEAPGAYKDIHTVMKHQRDLVDIIARFDPKIVRMSGA